MSIGLSELITGVFRPAAELIDSMHTSTEEKLIQKAKLLEIQAAAMDKSLEYELKTLQSRGEIIAAEAKSEHVITATWRPIVMLVFCALAVGDSLGLLSTPLRDEAWGLLQLGIGGYIAGRSAEKVTKAVLEARSP